MKDFILNNSALLLALLVVVVGFIQAIIAKNKHKIYASIYELVTDAEKLESANVDKFNYVFNAAYNKLPAVLKLFVSKDDIARAIEYSLNKLKDFAKAQSVPVETPVEAPANPQ